MGCQDHLSGQPVKYVEEVKYLGVVFDAKTGWQAHSKENITKVRYVLAELRRAVGNTWGLGPTQVCWSALARPLLAYGAIVWARATEGGCKTQAAATPETGHKDYDSSLQDLTLGGP